MKKIFIIIFSLIIPSLLIVSIYRKAIDKPPLTLSKAVNILSSVDIDFSTTVQWLDEIKNTWEDLKPTSFEDIESVGDMFTKLGNYILNLAKIQLYIFYVPMSILFDIIEFVNSIFLIIFRLFGIELPIPTPP